jgi:hypothetical protein
MITTTYKLTNYTDYLHQLAALFGTTVSDNAFQLPEAAGSGSFRVLALDDGPEALLYDFTLKDTLVLRRQPNQEEYYTLVLDALDRERSFRLKIDADEANTTVDRAVVFYLTSFLYDVESVLDAGVHIKGVRVLLSVSWMQHYLHLAENEGVLEKYLALKAAGIWYKPVNDELLTLLTDLLGDAGKPPLFYQNRVLRIVELFFEWLYNEMQVVSGQTGLSRHDIETVQK